MKLDTVEAIAVRAPSLESVFVKIETATGLTGWGEVQAPRITQAACDIIHSLLQPALEGADFDGSPQAVEMLREVMFARNEARTDGLVAAAINGVDLALWDLAGKIKGQPVSRLLAGERARTEVSAFVTGLRAADGEGTVRCCRDLHRAGFRYFELDYDCEPARLTRTLEALRDELGGLAGIAIDARSRMNVLTAMEVARRGVLWLKTPLPVDDQSGYARLAGSIARRIAIGDRIHTRREMMPFFEKKAVGVVQPDLGCCGLTEALRIALHASEHDVKIALPVGPSLGPRLAAAIQLAAILPVGTLVEYDPEIVAAANWLTGNSPARAGKYVVSQLPGLGLEIDEPELRLMEERSR